MNGKFPGHTELQLPANLGNPIQLADMNGDGKLDAVSAAAFKNGLGITVGMGGGKFGATTQVNTVSASARIDIADFNVQVDRNRAQARHTDSARPGTTVRSKAPAVRTKAPPYQGSRPPSPPALFRPP